MSVIRKYCNGAFDMYKGDLVQWYFLEEQHCFDSDGVRFSVCQVPENAVRMIKSHRKGHGAFEHYDDNRVFARAMTNAGHDEAVDIIVFSIYANIPLDLL